MFYTLLLLLLGEAEAKYEVNKSMRVVSFLKGDSKRILLC